MDIARTAYDSDALLLCERLEGAGYEAYVVGGAVRDALLGKRADDVDITTSARPEEVMEVFCDLHTIPTGLSHGTVTVVLEGKPFEITTYRQDGEYLDARHPSSVIFTDRLSLDLSRRDFTVNAMAYSEARGLVDLFGGRDDLARGLIRAVGNAEERFSEDALRIMRAFRFASKLDFDIEESTLLAARSKREGLSRVARERISTELRKLVCGVGAVRGCKLMKECGIFPYIFGDYEPSEREIASLGGAAEDERVRLGILLSGADEPSLSAILGGLRLSNELSHAVSSVVRALREIHDFKNSADIRRFLAKYREHSHPALLAASALGKISAEGFTAAQSETAKDPCVTLSQLAIGGSELIEIGISGREIGRVLSLLLERVIEQPELNERELLLEIARGISLDSNKN